MKRVPTQEKPSELFSPGATLSTRPSSRKKARKTFVIDLAATTPIVKLNFESPIISP